MESVFSNPDKIQQFGGQPDLFFRMNITLQVMTVADVSTGHQHTVGTLLKSTDDKHRVHPPGTHDANGSQVGWVLQSRDAGQIRTGVRTPVTQKSDNFWFKISHLLTI
jgi:hypothetical protein